MGEGDDLLLASVEGGQFQRILVGFCSRVNEEELVVVVTTDRAELFGKFHLQRVLDGIGVEHEFAGLLLHGLQVTWMAVTNGDHGMSTIEVEIFLSLVVPHIASLAMVNGHIK